VSVLLFDLSAAASLVDALARRPGIELGGLERRRFPDGEAYVRLLSNVRDRDVVLLCSLDRPDTKVMPLLFAAAAARAQGARSVGLAAPYLAYMRQDKAFRSGEAVTSETFAQIISRHFSWLVTLDPHLHRHSSLGEIYSIPAIAGTAAEEIGRWVKTEVERPVIVGPDEESRQWTEKIAAAASAPAVVLRKERSGDFDVSITGEESTSFSARTPVIVDDIVSTAATMIETVRVLREAGHPDPVCIAVHPIFAGESYARLLEVGPARVVSTNCVAHETNAIDVSATLGSAVEEAAFLVQPVD